MGESRAREALEGRTGPPTFAELFRAGTREHRREALQLIRRYEADGDDLIHMRRKLAEAWREFNGRRQFLNLRAKLERIGRRLRALAPAFQRVAPYSPPDGQQAVFLLFWALAQSAPPRWRDPAGPPRRPYVPKAVRDLGLPEDEGRILLRAIGISLSTGARSRR